MQLICHPVTYFHVHMRHVSFSDKVSMLYCVIALCADMIFIKFHYIQSILSRSSLQEVMNGTVMSVDECITHA